MVLSPRIPFFSSSPAQAPAPVVESPSSSTPPIHRAMDAAAVPSTPSNTIPLSPLSDKNIRVLLIPHKDPTRTTPSSAFDPVDRELVDGVVLKLGRQVRSPANAPTNTGAGSLSSPTPATVAAPSVVADGTLQQPPSPGAILAGNVNSTPSNQEQRGGKIIDNIWFKSKVVSRSHSEMWVKDGQLYIKDGGSSSGTFLNRMRLSPSGKESRPYPLKDGDIIQLGVDYGGKSEEIYKCVIMKISINSHSLFVQQRKKENPARFRTALRQLLTATNPYSTSKDSPTSPSQTATVDCCICLCTIGPFQALFLAPCSHCYHYKCIRSLLAECVMFQCPLCRQVANLEASVSMESLCDLAAEDPVEKEDAASIHDSDEQGNQDGVVVNNKEGIAAVDATTQLQRLLATVKAVPPANDDQRRILEDLESQLASLKIRIGERVGESSGDAINWSAQTDSSSGLARSMHKNHTFVHEGGVESTDTETDADL
ncbi:hypothetical protein SmJEL517_g06043 [Synchytrium microbalum]|uniref:SMAD/FHA domain-containing protein n=1 Tax=Synchytrium microbalum TaxID=1806994 RepID=A0A507BSU0_9FUNG|nr:uncharacterized protein SmJEL517_g06043 [Synchytrium microbalum]TPX30391.1 hypothetical protein SmJEL517_g06043 [Synchytrium microbalum]